MKKFTKFLGIFLALSMVIGMLSVVGAVDPEPAAPAAPTGAILQGTTYEVVSPTRIETLFGFYEDGTGEDEDTFLDCEVGACVTDGWFGRAGYSECTSDDGLIALVMMVDDFINLGAIEIVAKDQGHRAVNFEIQVMGDADWETVVTADNDPLADCLTKTFTFDAVETDTVRILITEVGPATDDDAGQCYFNEVTLFEAGTGNLKTVIDMNGKVTASNANTSDCTNNAVDGDKSTFFTGSWMTVDLGEATAIDGFNLYHYRNSSYPDNITVSIQQTEGGEFVQIGTFATSFTSGAPVDSLYVTFDQTYMAYAITFGSDVWGYQNDYELWQYQREAEEEPTVAPTEPAEPTYELTTGAPTTGVAYKWAADTGAAEGILTFIGTSANQTYYLSTSTTMTEGVDVYIEEVTGGYRMYFMAGETKTYIDIYQNGTYVNARLTTEPTAVFTWNDTFGTFVTDISGTAYYLGTYTKASSGVTYTTLSASKLSYMNESNVDVSQFPARFYTEVGTIIPEPTEAPTEEPTPAPTEEPTPAPTEEPTPAPTEEPTPAPTYNWIDLIPESQLTPAVGYYADGDYTTLTDINVGESGLLTDARVSSGSWVNGNTFPVPNDKVPAAVVEVDGTKIFAGVNICCKPGQELTDFVIEVKNTNGDWVTVNTTAGNTETDVKIIFDTAVLGTAVRMIIIDWNGEHPMVQELWVYEGLNTEPLVQVPVAGVTASQNPVVAEQSVDLVVDGKGFTYYQIGAGNMPVDIIFDTTNADGSATNVSRMRIYAYNNSKQAAKDIVVSVKTANEPETWETVYTGVAYELNHTDTFVLDFGATYAAYDVRLTINTVTAENLVLTEVELFGNGEPVAPPTVTPTEPTEEPTAEPTQEPTAEPTQEPTKLVGPDGVVNEIVLSNMGTLGSMGITPEFGYYDNAEMTGSVIDYQAAAGEDACLVDGNTNNSGWSGNFNFTDLVDNGGSKVPVILVDLGTATTVGGIELISVLNTCSAPTHFAVQVTTAADSDVWETVLEANNVTWNGKETKQFAFDNAVDAYKLRLVVFNLSELAGSTQTQFALHELTLMSAQEVPKVDKAPLSGSNVLQFGYFADLELTDYRDSVLSNNVPANLFDGNSSSLAITNTEAWTWGSGAGMAANGGTNTAVLTLDVTQNGEPTAINYMQMVVQGQYRYAPTTYTLQVTTSATEDNWTTVYEVTDFSWEDNGSSDHYVTFDEVSAYKVRLLVAKTHVDQNNLCYFGMGEFVLGTVEIVDIPDDPTDPTDPTTPSEPEPTTPSEPEPTTPAETEPTVPGEALPEAPVVLPGTTTIAGGVVKEGTVYKLISTKKITTGFGYYNASGAFVDPKNGEEGACVTDGWYGRAGYSECTSADGQIALIMTLDEVKSIGRVEIVGRTLNGTADNRPVDFEIQALVNGEWITVADVDDDPFATSMTVAYTFPAVATNQIRILINEVVIPTNQCHLNEVELYEVTTGKIYNDIDLTGKITATDAHDSAPAEQLIDGDKDTYFLGANITFNLTDAEGNPTSVDGFRMFHYRGGSAFPSSVTVLVQTTPGGDFTALNAYVTGWMNTVPQDQVIVEFDETVTVYGMQVNLDSYSYVNEFELFQYEKDEAPEEPPVDPTPTDPTEPSAPATEPSAPATEPSAPATEPSAPATQPSTPTEPEEELDTTDLDATLELIDGLDFSAYTDESAAALEAVLAEVNEILASDDLTQQMIDDANAMLQAAIDELVPAEEELPPVPELPGLTVDITELQAVIDAIHGLNPNEYTEDSYAGLVDVVKQVNTIISAGNYTQKLIDTVTGRLIDALNGLVKIPGGSEDIPGGDDTDLPADTGDIALTVLSALMTLSAAGGAVVISKKKFF